MYDDTVCYYFYIFSFFLSSSFSIKLVIFVNKWFYINLLVLYILIWKFANSSFLPHTIVGAIGFLLILFNWTRHAVFSTLRSNLERSKKIIFANISKKVLPYHKWIGTTALLIVIIHMTLIILRYGWQLSNFKMISGLFSGIVLANVVLTGWMRFIRPSVKKRMAHLWLGLTLFFLVVFHLII